MSAEDATYDDGGETHTPGDGTESIDPEELHRQLSAIRGAIGLEERYPGQRRLWVVAGIIVAVTSVLVNLLFAVPPDRYPPWLEAWMFFVAWLLFALVIGGAVLVLASRISTGPTPPTAPDWRVLFGTLVLLFVSLGTLLGPMVETVVPVLSSVDAGRLTGGLAYGLVLAIAGAGFLITGNVLRSYRIRRADRWVFYGAGLWMLGYAAVFTHVTSLQLIGYGLFGILFLLYSIGAYVALGRTDGT